jgi:hypothetical protein
MFDTTTLKAGDRVGFYGSHDFKMGTENVERVTPSGQVVLMDGKRFSKDGRLMGESYSWLRLMSADDVDAAKARKAEQRARNDRAAALRQRVDAILAGRRNGYGDQHAISDEEKAELIALVQAL